MTSNHLLLFRLAELMLEHEQHILPVDLLFDDPQIGDFAKSIQIDSPYQQMLLEGSLTEFVRNDMLYVSYTVEGYFHYVLGEVIYNRTEGQGAESLMQIVEENRLNGAKEGIEQCLIRDVRNNDLNRLLRLIDESDKSLELAVLSLSNALLSVKISDVLGALLKTPSFNDLLILKKVCSFLDKKFIFNLPQGIKNYINNLESVKALVLESFNSKKIKDLKENLKLFAELNINLTDAEKKVEIKKIKRRISNELKKKSSNYLECLEWISILVDLNELDAAIRYYSNILIQAEKASELELLVQVLEQLGECELKRSCKDGYRAAIIALTRASEIRESELLSQNDNLKKTYRFLGFAYLSLGLQLVKAAEYFEKAKAITLKLNSESDELAESSLHIGLVYYWSGLRGVGRWGHADPSLLEGLDIDLFEYADAQFQQAFNYHLKHLGKTHPQTFKALHYLQENRYALGNYEMAIPWLKKYTEALPFKAKEHTDNFYRYCLIVSLEEHAKQLALSDPQKALALIQDAFQYIQNYDEDGEIGNRLEHVKNQIEAGTIEEPFYQKIDELPPLETETRYKGVWCKWQYSDELKGFQTNNWMVSAFGVWFFNGEKKQLIFWDSGADSLSVFCPSHWPDGCNRLVFDQKNQVFYAWSSIRSTVYELTSADGSWNRISFGVHDVHDCGASYAFDPINNRLFEFGGYGYFTYKNWLWVYDISERKWIQLKENKPGISPYPRNGQLLPLDNGNSALLVSGIGSDTGIQREHKARFGLGSATDVGYFTWLRDAHKLDFTTMEWKTLLPANHNTIRHEGAIGYLPQLKLVLNWGGVIPSPEFEVDLANQNKLTCWNLDDPNGFKDMHFEGIMPQTSPGLFVLDDNQNYLLFMCDNGIWKLSIDDF